MSNEIFVTGLGIVSPAGLTADATWQALLTNARCVQAAPDHWPGKVAAPVPGWVSPPAWVHRDRTCQMALAAAAQAIATDPASFRATLGDRRLGISVGTSKGGIHHFAALASALMRPSRSRSQTPPPFDIPPDSAARAICEWLCIAARVHASVAACTTGTLAVIRGAQMIQDKEADLVLCGGADASLHPLWLAAFEQMGALATPHPDLGPAYACQPYDRNRRGFAAGEGAGMLLLESAPTMKTRGSTPLARLAGWAMASDPAGLTQLTESGEVLAHAVSLACSKAGVSPTDLSGIHAHGTGTLANDRTEARACEMVLGQNIAEVPVVSAKGAIGHLLGAAGAVELALAVLSCSQRRCFANATLLEPDPQCARLQLPTGPVRLDAGPILKTALGFGGHVAAVVIAPL